MPELEQKIFQKRQVAYKVKISDILSENFTKDEFSAGYIKLNEVNISRVDVIATVIYKSESLSYASAVIDDGTGKISLRSFGNTNAFSKLDVGDIVLIIGKIREFNGEKYIMPEILKKVNNADWINVRKLELEKTSISNRNTSIADKVVFEDADTGIIGEIYSLIKKLDSGEGVSIDDVIKISNRREAESIIKRLIENGDIFEITSGKVKVLE